MIVRLKPNLLLITAPSQEHQETLIPWAKDVDGHAFILQVQDTQTIRLISRGPESDACREPINVTSRSPIREIQLISNFAHTPFELDGVLYGSVEAFWQTRPRQDLRFRSSCMCRSRKRSVDRECLVSGTRQIRSSIPAA